MTSASSTLPLLQRSLIDDKLSARLRVDITDALFWIGNVEDLSDVTATEAPPTIFHGRKGRRPILLLPATPSLKHSLAGWMLLGHATKAMG